MSSVEEIRNVLKKYGQEHLLQFWDDLNEVERGILIKDIENLRLEETVNFFKKVSDTSSNQENLNSSLKPVPDELCGSVNRINDCDLKNYECEGLKQISNGHVGVLLLAGGQGTRLGVSEPKGMFDIGLPSKKTLFQIQAERILKLQNLAEARFSKVCAIPWYIMTSAATTKNTKEFFKKNNYFGLNPKNIYMFEQGMLPCFDFEGKILMESKHKIAMSPDGNGGLYKALKQNHILEDMDKKNVKYLHAYCVDNILVKVADPVFIGYCIKKGAECAAKVVEKISPNEPIGVVCYASNKWQVVEYSEISFENANQRNQDGTLKLKAGNICNHFFTSDFLKNVANQFESKLKLHRAEKKITYINNQGKKIKPETPNGVKIEKFVFDVFPFASKFVIWEVNRDEEFSALKNSIDYDKDNADTSKQALFNLHKKYIQAAGGDIKGEGPCEISPLLSYAGEGLESLCKGKSFSFPVYLKEDETLPVKCNGNH